jgi:fibronectin-binding autotransporter adhesin
MVCLMSPSIQAASETWKIVATNGNWHDLNNWIGGAIPNGSADAVTFNSTSNFSTISIGNTATNVDRFTFSAGAAAFTLTGTSSTNLLMSTNGGGVFIDSGVTSNQDLSGIPIIRPGMDDTLNFSNQGSGSLKLGTFQAENSAGTLSTLLFKPGANGAIEIANGKKIDNAGTGGVKKIAIVLDDVGTLKIAATGSYDGSNADGNSVSIRQGTLEAAVIKNSGSQSSLGAGGRIQFGTAATTNTATLNYYGATDTTNRAFQIVDNNTAVFKISGGISNKLTITSSITQSGSANGGGKLSKDGAGILTLGGSNSHSSQTLIVAGRLVAAHANALGTSGSYSSRTSISTGGTLEIATDTSIANEFLDITSGNSGAVVVNRATLGVGITQSTGTTYLGSASTMNVTQGANVTSGTARLGIGSVILAGGSVGKGTLNSDTAAISITGAVSSGVAFGKTLELAGAHAESEISGPISNGSGTVSIDKTGTGTWTLSNTNHSYTGSTTVTAGTLVVNGNISTSSTTVKDSATLGGSGTVGTVLFEAGATLAPGNSAGSITFAGDLSLGLNSISNFEINAFTLGSYDLAEAHVTGVQTVNFNSGILNLLFQPGFNTTGAVKIFDFDAYAGSGFTSVNVSGLADGYEASFDSNNGMVTVVPEPSALSWVCFMAGATVLRRRRN